VLDDQAANFMNEVIFTAIESAKKPDDLSEPLGHLLTLLNDLVNAQERLARTRADTPRMPRPKRRRAASDGRTANCRTIALCVSAAVFRARRTRGFGRDPGA